MAVGVLAYLLSHYGWVSWLSSVVPAHRNMTWIWVALVVVLTTFLLLMGRRVRQAQGRLARTESRLAAVLEGPEAGLAVWSAERRLVGFNQRFKEFYPDAPLKPGVVFEDLMRYTANRGLVQVADNDDDDEIERWVSMWAERVGSAAHDVWRTPDGRWIDVHLRPTDGGEVLLLLGDITHTREAEASVSDHSHQAERRAAELDLITGLISAGQTESGELAAIQIIERVCVWAGWSAGFVYRVVPPHAGETGRVDVVASWYVDAEDAGRFAQLKAFVEGDTGQGESGLAARVRQSGRVVWIPNVSVDPTFDSDRRSVMTGIRGACAVPVTEGPDGRVIAVLEFLSDTPLTPDPTTTQLLEAAAGMVAVVLTSRNAG